VTDLTHARVHLRAEGARAAWVLAKGVAIDLHADRFPVGRTAVTEIDRIGVVLRRAARDAFDLLPYRGYACALVDWLERAGRRDTL
jgi:sarcosine oxidase subunit gamma